MRKKNLERTDHDNEGNNKTGKEKEEGKMWSKVRTLLQDCTDVDALTQVGYIPIWFSFIENDDLLLQKTNIAEILDIRFSGFLPLLEIRENWKASGNLVFFSKIRQKK